MKPNMNQISPDNLEEARELLEYALDSHSWPSVEEALLLIKEALGYEVDEEPEEEDE